MLTTFHPSSSLHPKRLIRSAVIVAVAIGLAAATFAAVLHFQPSTPPAGPTAGGPPMVTVVEPDPVLHGGIGGGDRPYFENFDGGKLVSRFRAERYMPAPDGTITVTKPVAEFFLAHDEVLRVTGDTGEVAFGTPTPGGGMPTAMHAPDTGTLHHVHIARFPTSDTTGRPTLTVDTDNVRFDNSSLRLFTEHIPATADAPEVPPDMVPVILRGDDYAMDGTGLTLRWNGRDRRLHLLEIAHGHRLTVFHPNALHADGEGTKVHGTAVGPAADWSQLASADPAAAALAVPAARVPTPPSPPYRGVFNDNVVVKQADQTLATGDVLTLDFLQGKSRGDPATQPAATQPATHPATAPVAMTPPATLPAVAATARPKPGSEPITIYWTGKLRVTPLESPPMMPLVRGDAVVRLAGAPATVAYNGASAVAAVATYRTGDRALRLDPSPACPDVTLQQKQTTVTARSVAYDPATSISTIVAPATLRVPSKSGQLMTVTWADRGLLHVTTDGTALSGVDHVDLAGDVRAIDPSAFALSSRRLLLDFDATPTTRPTGGDGAERQLRRLTATGDATCRTFRNGVDERGIEGDRLVVGLSPDVAGHPSPRTVVADGKVRVSDPQQALSAHHLEAVLASKPKPTTRAATTEPADGVNLTSLVATGDVRAVLKNGTQVAADVLREETAPDGRQLVELSGAQPPVVTSGKGERLSGSVLRVATGPGGDVIVVDGPGTMHPAPKPSTRPSAVPPRPMDIAWSDGLSYDAAANMADVVGNVVAKSVDANGTVDTVTGDRAHIVLSDPAKAAKPVPAGDADNFGNRELRSLALIGHMHAKSELDAGTVVVRHGELFGGRLDYTAADDAARVPGPGQMFVENHRPPTTVPVAHDGGNAGAMAVRWRDGLTFDRPTNKVTIVGDAKVGFRQDAARPADAAPMQLRSEKLVITLRPAKAVGPSKSPVSHMTATTRVHFRAREIDVDCHAADYDPDTGLLTVRGSSAEPGRGVDAGGAAGGFDTLVFDTVKQEVVGGTGVSGTFRR